MSNPVISVVIPVCNRAHTILRTLTSVTQIKVPFEIIIVDDGSSDQTAEIVRDFIATSAHGYTMHLLVQENKGAPVARNVGWKMAKSDWILFLDSDDEIIANFVRESVAAISEKSELEIVYGGYRIKKEDKIIRTSQAFSEENALDGLISSWVTHPSAILFRKDLIQQIGGWDETLPAMQDFQFTLQAFLHAQHIKRLRLYAVTVSEDGSDRISDKRFRNFGDQINKQLFSAITLLKAHNQWKAQEVNLQVRVRTYIHNFLRAGNKQSAVDLLYKMDIYGYDSGLSIWKIMLIKIMPITILRFVYRG